jgi:hypothetical protein
MTKLLRFRDLQARGIINNWPSLKTGSKMTASRPGA